jgi:aminoglycoside phosphotransferase (APT) family kinase protein
VLLPLANITVVALFDAGFSPMIGEIAPGAAIRNVGPIGGGLASDTFAVDTTAGDFVVKVFRPHRRAEALPEWDRLTFAQRVSGVAVPEPVALDVHGRWFGAPALVMSRLPGRVDLTPTDLDGWLRQLAHALAAIHRTDATGAAGPLLGDPPLGHWGIGDWQRLESEWAPTALVDRCVAAIRRHRLWVNDTPALVHGDFHPGNIVWRNGTLTGVVDWSAARIGSRSFEFAQCRAGVALLFGMPGVRRLTEHYVGIVGTTPVDLPVFDLMCGLVARSLGPTRWLASYRIQGCIDTPRQLAARMPPFLRQALAELGA